MLKPSLLYFKRYSECKEFLRYYQNGRYNERDLEKEMIRQGTVSKSSFPFIICIGTTAFMLLIYWLEKLLTGFLRNRYLDIRDIIYYSMETTFDLNLLWDYKGNLLSVVFQGSLLS